MQFASDNTSGVCAEILAAVIETATGYAPSYGDDEVTAGLTRRFTALFEREVAVIPVVSGTAANALALGGMTAPHGLMFCHRDAHVSVDEAGAPEFFSNGARLVALEGSGGKIEPSALERAAHRPGHGVHSSLPSAVSLTQSTEAGTVYSLDQVARLAEIAHDAGMGVHMDGARFANAVAALGCTPAEASWRSGVDVLSFGATKNGAIGAEAMVYFEPDAVGDIERRRKRAGHLLSKMRFVSAQFLAYLDDDLWLRNAAHANSMAADLSTGLAGLDLEIVVPTEANEVFVAFPTDLAVSLREVGAAFFDERIDGRQAARLVTSFSTTADDVRQLLRAATDLSSAPATSRETR